ncbi:transcription factor LHW-like [Oryza brachyantha]|uniref:BHLH domain-containing protein n=1 Tax=Oryza brachyantha TaxID=4533 RepID=J3L653_ORYBR|nr:transcription factor LHW-like [Oryza brachyantha]
MAGATPLRDSLRSLCADVGWSYAVFWRATRAADSPQLQLVWGDGHCEREAGAPAISGFEAMDLLLKEKAAALRGGAGRGGGGGGGEGHAPEGSAGHGQDRVDELVHKAMAQQLHVVGKGVIGQAAVTGLHRWILHDSLDECEEEDEVLLEMKDQFCAGIQTVAVIPVLPQGVIQLGSTKMVMEEASFVDHVRSLFQQLGSSIAVVPHGSFVQDSVMKTPFHKLPGVPTSSLLENLAGSGNTYNDDMINHQFGHQISPASTIQSFNSVQHFYTGPTFCHSVTTASHCRGFRPDHGNTFTLNSQSENNKSAVLPKNNVSHSETSNDAFSHAFNPLNEPNVSISVRRECISIEQHGSCRNGNMKITKGRTASSCTGETNILNKVDDLQSQDCQTSNATSVNTKFQTMSIVDNTKLQDGSYTIPDAAFVDSTQYPSCFQSLLGNLHGSSTTNSNVIHADTSHNAVPGENNFCPLGDRNATNSSGVPELLVSPIPLGLTGGNDLFDVLQLQQKPSGSNDSEPNDRESMPYGSEQAVKSLIGCVDDDFTGLITEADPDQLLDAIVSKIITGHRQNVDSSASCSSSVASFDRPLHSDCHPYTKGLSSGQMFCNFTSVSPGTIKSEVPAEGLRQSSPSIDKSEGCSQTQQSYRSHIRLWVENNHNVGSDSLSTGQASDSLSAGQCKRSDEIGKSNRKRSRPGESARPRPKDRQMIQDRIKELREIVPSSAKCSIDALLEKTIKHMLFLQNVAKHADKLKESGESKIVSQETQEEGLLLKDNFEGGATWAFEVGTRSMTCPIIVEDLSPPRQMLVEMLCKERGIFLEIADQIRGLGLTILKGVMEVRKDKIWARFAVEANKDVTRMEIFLSLVHLLEPSTGSSILSAGVENISLPPNGFFPSSIPATGFSNCL